MSKFALFVFNGDPMCFIHVLLNALDMKEKGHEVQIVIEGAATKLLPSLEEKENPLNHLWIKAKEQGLIAGVCKACASKMGTLDAAQSIGLSLLDAMKGHPSMTSFYQKDFTIITF